MDNIRKEQQRISVDVTDEELQMILRLRALSPQQRKRIRETAQQTTPDRLWQYIQAHVPPCPQCGNADLDLLKYLKPMGYEVYFIDAEMKDQPRITISRMDDTLNRNVFVRHDSGQEVCGRVQPAMRCWMCDRIYPAGKFRYDEER